MSGHPSAPFPLGAAGGPFDLPSVLMVRLRTELMRERVERQDRHRRRIQSDLQHASRRSTRPVPTVRTDLPR